MINGKMNNNVVSTLVNPATKRNIPAIIKLIKRGLIIKNSAVKHIARAKISLCKVTEYEVSIGENDTKRVPAVAKKGLNIFLPIR